MFSYIFMKILESRPWRYDKGINILSCGHAKKIKNEIVLNWIRPGTKMLDVGCGTGELLADAARAGAHVTGIDISEGMLQVARKRFEAPVLKGKETLYHASVTELDELFADNAFDLIASTLVFSELYPAERIWAMNEFHRILKPSGVLILADEIQPRAFIKRLVYSIMRVPLVIVTYFVAQIGTKAIPDIMTEISQAGFSLLSEKRSLLDSFALVCAQKTEKKETIERSDVRILLPEEDISIVKSIWDYIGRWFPNPVEPGLRRLGSPDHNSPVLVTSNFHLTVRRVEKALSATDVWLLVAPTNGINVWCSSAGGEMTVHSLLTVMKTSRVRDRVTHRRLILPQLSAPGIDRKQLKETSGWSAEFGPVYAKDIPAFLEQDHKKIAELCRVSYPISFRFEMLLSMNALVWAAISIVLIFIKPSWALSLSAFFWGAGIFLYGGFPYLPGKSGWAKASVLSILLAICIALYSVFILKQPWWHFWGWMTGVAILTLWLGFDLKGIVGGSQSEPESLLHKLGVGSIGQIHKSRTNLTGSISHDPDLCTSCGTCIMVCPKAVFIRTQKTGKVILGDSKACFRCQACLKQCLSKAISIQ
jgi:ubiquinone/menaquinone biosynthesis C-methylase UbiE/NAD-dependent dihydropyrimidine dehydrogenase PreA subunit